MLLVSYSLDWENVSNPNLPCWSTHLEIPLITNIMTIDEIISKIKAGSCDNESFETEEQCTENGYIWTTDISIVKISLIEDASGDSILYAFQDEIEMSNLDQKTLVDSIKVEVVGEYIGGVNAEIPIDLANDFFTVFISANDLKVSSAIAIIPPKSKPINDENAVPVSDSENRLAWALQLHLFSKQN